MSIDRIAQPTQPSTDAYEPDREVVEHLENQPAELPDEADQGDAYEQSLIVEADEDDYR